MSDVINLDHLSYHRLRQLAILYGLRLKSPPKTLLLQRLSALIALDPEPARQFHHNMSDSPSTGTPSSDTNLPPSASSPPILPPTTDTANDSSSSSSAQPVMSSTSPIPATGALLQPVPPIQLPQAIGSQQAPVPPAIPSPGQHQVGFVQPPVSPSVPVQPPATLTQVTVSPGVSNSSVDASGHPTVPTTTSQLIAALNTVFGAVSSSSHPLLTHIQSGLQGSHGPKRSSSQPTNLVNSALQSLSSQSGHQQNNNPLPATGMVSTPILQQPSVMEQAQGLLSNYANLIQASINAAHNTNQATPFSEADLQQVCQVITNLQPVPTVTPPATLTCTVKTDLSPQLPTEDIKSFIQRAECFFRIMNVQGQQRLALLLTKVLPWVQTHATRLMGSEMFTYEQVRDQLIQHFMPNKMQLLSRFRNLIKAQNETWTQFGERLKYAYLDYVGTDLFEYNRNPQVFLPPLREQLFRLLSPSTRAILRGRMLENSFLTWEDFLVLADAYFQPDRNPSSQDRTMANAPVANSNLRQSLLDGNVSQSTFPTHVSPNRASPTCFRCHQVGHIARNCMGTSNQPGNNRRF